MKKIAVSAMSGILFVIIGTFLLAPFFNDLYVSYKNLEPGPDAESELLDLLVFVQWPIYFFIGFFLSYLLYAKRRTNKAQ